MPSKVSKPSAIITAETLQQHLKQSLNTGRFPINLRNANVTPVF